MICFVDSSVYLLIPNFFLMLRVQFKISYVVHITSLLDSAERLSMAVVPFIPKAVDVVVLSRGSVHLLKRPLHLWSVHICGAKPVRAVVDQKPWR